MALLLMPEHLVVVSLVARRKHSRQERMATFFGQVSIAVAEKKSASSSKQIEYQLVPKA